jgi:hypothetical protein
MRALFGFNCLSLPFLGVYFGRTQALSNLNNARLVDFASSFSEFTGKPLRGSLRFGCPAPCLRGGNLPIPILRVLVICVVVTGSEPDPF